MKDFYAILKVQHGPLRQAMLSAGIKTPKELATLAKVNPTSVYNILNFKISPLNLQTGKWKKTALLICRFLGFSTEELFPSHLQKIVATNKFDTFASANNLPSAEEPRFLLPSESMDSEELKELFRKSLEHLSPRQRYIINARFFEDKTSAQIAKELKCSQSNVNNQELAAIRHMRHPSIMRKYLKEAHVFIES